MSGWSLQEALTRGRGRERPFRCPVHGDRTASASVNVAKGVWVCYACGAHGTVDEVIESEGYQFLAEVNDLMEEPPRVYPENWVDQYDRLIHPYWQTRFTDEAIRAFRLGWDNSWLFGGQLRAAPCYPMRNASGEVLGMVHRNLSGDGPKYVYPRGVEKRDMLFNYASTDYQDTIVLVEGALDVVACWEAGVKAYGLYGSNLHQHQLELLARTTKRKIVLALDNDRAGQQAIHGWTRDDGSKVIGLQTRLERLGYETVLPDWQTLQAKDVAEITIETRKTLLQPLVL